jgi:hypothetical protein
MKNVYTLLKPKPLLAILFFIGCMAISYESLTNAAGAPFKKSGAPGELDCTDCHNGTAISSGKQWNNISLTTNTGSTLDYIPDSTYTITLDYTESGQNQIWI